MRPTERAIGMEEGEGRESRHLTICFSNSHRNPHYICDSNFFANIISIFITIPIFDSNSDSISDSNAITESDNSSGWILRREVE
jgi:dynactin complex subunit